MNTLRQSSLLLIAIALILALCTSAILAGPTDVSPGELLQILLNTVSEASFAGIFAEPEPWKESIVLQVRLPRVITALFVGSALAVCGAVLQGLFRNPLASPSVLGVSSGAALGAVIAIFAGLAATTFWALPSFAFAGSAITLFVVYRLATFRGQTPIDTLLLAGIAVSAFNIAMSSLVLALAQRNWELSKSIIYWTMGGLDSSSWYHVAIIAPVFILCLTIISAFRRDLDILMVGEIHASSVGVDVAKLRLYLLIVTSLLTGVAVSVAGGIGFIGLVVPHLSRLLVGPYHHRLLPVSAVLGGVLLVAADLLVRWNESSALIPLGVITASMGAPFFAFLLYRQRKIGTF